MNDTFLVKTKNPPAFFSVWAHIFLLPERNGAAALYYH